MDYVALRAMGDLWSWPIGANFGDRTVEVCIMNVGCMCVPVSVGLRRTAGHHVLWLGGAWGVGVVAHSAMGSIWSRPVGASIGGHVVGCIVVEDGSIE